MQPRADGLGISFMQTVAIESKALDRFERAVWVQPRAAVDELRRKRPVTPQGALMPAPVLLSAVTRGAVEFTRTPTFASAVRWVASWKPS